MAASLSRPDPSSPASVAEAAFNTARRGFQPDEVRAFLVAVAAEMGRLQERERQLEAELSEARSVEAPAELDDETVANLLGEETLRVLHTARESASQIKIRAEEAAARILREANDEVNRLRQEADVEAARRRQDAASDAEAEVALAKQQGREMVNEARAYRERVLADLERRTTLARQQIEELIHGRDRLLQVFERARLVAVDVTSELTAIDSPDELVNLTPTTGPVPIMVPNDDSRPTRQADAPAAAGADAEPATEARDRTSDPASVGESDGEEEADDDAGDPTDTAHETAEPDATDATDATEVDEAADEPDVTDDPAAGDDTDDGDGAVADDADAADDADDVDEAAATTADDDAGSATAQTADGVPDAAAKQSETNVVSLFRSRTAPADAAAADDHPSTDSATGDAGDSSESGRRPDVGGIFERLRQEVPSTESATDTTPGDTTPDDTTAADATGEPVTDDTDGTDESATHATPAADADDDADDAVESTPFTRRDEALVPLIVSGARRLKRVLADEQNEALDTLRQGDPVTELDALVAPVDEHVATYLAALDDDLQSAAVEGAGELGANDTKTLRKSLGKAGALDRAKAHVRASLVGPLRDRLERAISDGAGDNDDITKRVRAVYREWKTQHIDDQLDDLFRSAYNGGFHATLAPGTPLVWTTDPRLTPCPDCEDNSLAGPITAGDEFPTGHPNAPAHPGCTCLAVPAD